MNNNEADSDSRDPQDQRSPMDEGVFAGPEKNKIPTEKVDRTTKNQRHDEWPNWIIATASVFLVFVTAFYTYYAKEQTVLTKEGLETSREMLIATIDAMRLDQRAWLTYSKYDIEVRENPKAPWVSREPTAGEEFRGRFFFENIGKTPAFNIQLMGSVPRLIPTGDVPQEPKWDSGPHRSVLFPNEAGFAHMTPFISLSDQEFSEYSSQKKEVFFWVKLNYCDITGRRHWTEAGISRDFGSKGFRIRSISINLDPGEVDHPECHN